MQTSCARWWEWPSALSLEAPLIAVLWQALSGQILGVPVSLHHRLLLAIGVWLSYVADRLNDARREPPKTARHEFAFKWRRPIAVAWILVAATGGIVFVKWANLSNWRRFGLGVGAAVALVHYLGRWRTRVRYGWAIWRFGVATVFSMGILLFVLPDSSASIDLVMSWSVGVWLVMASNMEVIAHAERAALARQSVKPPHPRLLSFTASLVAFSVAIPWLTGRSPAFSVSVSAAPVSLLVLLFIYEWSAMKWAAMDVEAVHALADLAIAAPPFLALLLG
jgi:hypothetical protein